MSVWLIELIFGMGFKESLFVDNWCQNSHFDASIPLQSLNPFYDYLLVNIWQKKISCKKMFKFVSSNILILHEMQGLNDVYQIILGQQNLKNAHNSTRWCLTCGKQTRTCGELSPLGGGEM